MFNIHTALDKAYCMRNLEGKYSVAASDLVQLKKLRQRATLHDPAHGCNRQQQVTLTLSMYADAELCVRV